MGKHVEYQVEYHWPSLDGEIGFVPFRTLAAARKFAEEYRKDGFKCRIIRETTVWTREVVK